MSFLRNFMTWNEGTEVPDQYYFWSGLSALAALVSRGPLFVLTGAGCSTPSGIPDYRDERGEWKRKQPVTYGEFVRREEVRRRYWARSLAGWGRLGGAEPNPAHRALATLEASGYVHHLLTQNVDGLHHKAGHRRVIDLHGRLDRVRCLGCGALSPRDRLQHELLARNPAFTAFVSAFAPDGDADLHEDTRLGGFEVPACESCGGALKPDVVFFGESVPRARVDEAYARLAECAAMLVVGSSLMVWSGYRFVRRAVEQGIPVAALNLGRTRADADLTLKLEARCDEVLPALAAWLGAGRRSTSAG